MKGFVYILKDDAGRYYIGSTDNLTRRIGHHKIGHTQTTRNMISPRLALSQIYDSLPEARKVERKIKALKRKDYIQKMVSDGYIKIKI